ncbi:YciI family protein [Lactococcus allomyrinae]|nr:YciI family protein [Lactococcus allomyrinae]
MITILLYTIGENVTREQIMSVFPRHKAWVDQFVDEQKIMGIGTFADPLKDGAMGLFPNMELAEEFVARDPFVKEGIVTKVKLKEWAGQFFTSIVR